MSMGQSYASDDGDWICAACGCVLEQQKTQIFYLESAFDVALPACPSCKLTLTPKSLAEGKMLEVEALLEDK